MWLCSGFRRPELKLPSAGGQGVRCGLNPMYGCHLSISLEEQTLTTTSEICDFSTDWKKLAFFTPSYRTFFPEPLAAIVVWARRYSDLGFQISLPNYSLYRKKTPDVPELSVSGKHGKLGQSPVESKCKVFT